MPNACSANGGTKATIDGVQLMGYQYITPSQIANLHLRRHRREPWYSHLGYRCWLARKQLFWYSSREADLILAGCGSLLTDNAIMSSAKYIGWYAQQLGKPCVISISLGSDIGPHDGNSIIISRA